MSDRVLRIDELTPEQRRLVLALIEANKSAQSPPAAVQGRPGMRHEVIKVTPELAAEWLSKPAARQRSTSRSAISNYARAMAEGRWHEPTTDPIAFTSAGLLLNGQHRLAALIKAGTTIEMLVAYDVPEELFNVIDTGRRRSASQFVRQPFAVELASAARLVLWYDQRRLADPKNPTQPTGAGAVSFDNDELLAFIEGSANAILTDSVREAKGAARWCGIPASIHGAILTIARREGADPAKVDSWLYGLVEGVGLEMDDPRRRLRQRLTDQANSKHIRRSVPAVWMLSVRAFNAYMQGRSVKALKYEPEDAPPAIDLTGQSANRERVERQRVVPRTAVGGTRMAANGSD